MDTSAAHAALARDSIAAPGQQHWTVTSPLATHWRAATCDEVGCIPHHSGWRVRVDLLGEVDVHAIRTSGRHWSECVIDEDPDTGQKYDPPAVYWIFEAGQPCFKAGAHRLPVGRPELYLVGDRGDVRRYDRSDQWVEDCATHTTKITKIVDKLKEG